MQGKLGDHHGLFISLVAGKDIGYPSTVALDKKGTLLTAFYTDYEPTLKEKSEFIQSSHNEVVGDWVDQTA